MKANFLTRLLVYALVSAVIMIQWTLFGFEMTVLGSLGFIVATEIMRVTHA